MRRKDNKTLSGEHDTYSCDAKQGSNRLNRGEYFYTQVKRIANSRKDNLSWTVKQVTAAHIVAHTNPPIEDPMLVSCAALEFSPISKVLIVTNISRSNTYILLLRQKRLFKRA